MFNIIGHLHDEGAVRWQITGEATWVALRSEGEGVGVCESVIGGGDRLGWYVWGSGGVCSIWIFWNNRNNPKNETNLPIL